MQAIFDLYHWEVTHFNTIHQGLINQSFEIQTKDGGSFILQTINHQIFKNPESIDYNINSISRYLSQNYPDYCFTHLVPNAKGESLTKFENRFYRAFKKINGHAFNVIERPDQADAAAKAFGKFTAILNDFDTPSLKITLPHFHDLTLRAAQFKEALIKGDSHRLAQSKEAIAYLQDQNKLVAQYQYFISSKESRQRVTHHDTKISNVLFNKKDEAICVIDLDTVMPGYYISDVGDMCRTYLCPVSEEESDLNLVRTEKSRWEALQKGYVSAMQSTLSNFELDHFVYAGQFMIYMQAIRFLSDHLNKDVYYGAKYDGQNYVRAINQIELLKRYNEMIH